MTKLLESASFVVVLHNDIAYRHSSFPLSNLLAGIGLCRQRAVGESERPRASSKERTTFCLPSLRKLSQIHQDILSFGRNESKDWHRPF